MYLYIEKIIFYIDWRSRGNALADLPLMIEATKAGVAMLLRNKSVGRFALMMVPSLSFEAYT